MFDIVRATDLCNSTNQFPVDFDELWKWVGYSRKDNAKKALLNNFEINLDYSSSWRSVTTTGIIATKKEIFNLTIDAAKMFCMLAQTEQVDTPQPEG